MHNALNNPAVTVVKSNTFRRGEIFMQWQVDAASLVSKKSIRKYDVFIFLSLPFITKDDIQ